MILARLAKLNRREKIGLAVALVCVMGWLVDLVVVHAVASGFRRLDGEIAQAKQDLLSNLRVLREEKQVAADYESVRDSLGVMSTPNEDTDVFKGELEELARKTGLLLKSIDHKPPLTATSHAEYPVEIGNFEGSSAALLDFLGGLRALPGLVNVVRITLGPGTEQGTVKGSMLVTKALRAKED